VDVPEQLPSARKVREAPVSFADHHSQARMFWLSMAPVERDHIIAAYTFELGKCYEQAVKERQLESLALIDPELCAGVAAGLGLPAPSPDAAPAEVEPSPALSQVGSTWPLDGRVIGIVADESSDLSGVDAVCESIHDAGMTPLVIAPHGGTLGEGDQQVVVQRSFATARSVEFDAVLLASAPAKAADAVVSLDAKAGATTSAEAMDPRVGLLVSECYRHGKAIGAWGEGGDALAPAGADPSSAGVVCGDDPADVLREVNRLLSRHRVWDRFSAQSR
jgi:catalase